MSVRVTARIRPILSLELEKDVIVEAACPGQETVGSPTLVRIPNPKNDAEYFSFQFSSVYDHRATQQEFFDNEGTAGKVISQVAELIFPQLRQRSSISSMASTEARAWRTEGSYRAC